jgi:5-(aminomethyl)-3-furanmethanol phosphate kinase
MADDPDLTVVKLGGSYAFSRQLPAWLDALAGCAGRVVIVPGGGPFADAVREAQPKMGFGDEAAHTMGMLAMTQYGRALASLGRGYVVAATVAAIRRALRARQVPVWSPFPMALRAPDLPASWDVTADSLATWLATRLRAARVLFVKQVAAENRSLDALVAAGVLDPFLPRLLCAHTLPAYIVGPGDQRAVSAAITAGRPVGMRLGNDDDSAG